MTNDVEKQQKKEIRKKRWKRITKKNRKDHWREKDRLRTKNRKKYNQRFYFKKRKTVRRVTTQKFHWGSILNYLGFYKTGPSLGRGGGVKTRKGVKIWGPLGFSFDSRTTIKGEEG